MKINSSNGILVLVQCGLWALRNVFVRVKSQEQLMKKYVTRPSISYTNSSTTPEEDKVVMVEQASQSNAEEDITIGRHGRHLE